jgi:carbonic anhydrase
MEEKTRTRHKRQGPKVPEDTPVVELQPPVQGQEALLLPEHLDQTSSAEPESGNVFSGIADPKPDTAVITCSDPRFQLAFRQFVEGKLGLVLGKDYIPFTVAGSAGAMARPETFPKEFKFMRERLELFRQHYKSLRRIIVINHEDCAYYKGLSKKAAGLLEPFHVHLPLADMQTIAKVFARLLSHLGMQLEMYYAKFVDGDPSKVVIDRVS